MTDKELDSLKALARFINEQANYAWENTKSAPEDSKKQGYWQGVTDTADNIYRQLKDILVEAVTDRLLEELKAKN